ncbi:MAG: hypothetical protein L6R41_002805 [Letrouitia leprolyta]|nr:MAG: hypothetical protein L6R41_002805 [Letrouitia leprolyta]
MRLPWPASLLWLLAACVNVYAAIEADPNNIRTIPLRSHSLSAPFLDSDMQSRFFDFGGDTIIRADQYVRLTSDRPSQEGWLFSRLPLTATNWEIDVEFKIHGQGNLHGDGMAIWLTKQRGQIGPVFGSVDRFEGLGVFIDTYKNQRPGVVFPYVMAMLGNSSVTYDKDHDGKDNEIAGCSARGIRSSSVPTKIRLTYFAEKSLTVTLQYKAENEWTECFETGPLTLPSVSYLGFSAETGELSDNHDIISIETKNKYINKGYSDQAAAGASGPYGTEKGGWVGRQFRREKERGSWKWFFFKVFVFGGVVVGGYVGWTMWRASQRDRF